MSSLSPFEQLPDEIILHVCQYLRGADILYCFYNLNTRLNSTITDFCHHVNLMNVSHQQFAYAVYDVLPDIGAMVRTFILNANWEIIIGKALHSILFESQLSVLFPRLERLVVKWFPSEKLVVVIDKLEDCHHLTRLDVHFLRGKPDENILSKILAANGRRLSVVLFDQDSSDLEISKKIENDVYPNITELSVNLALSEFIPQLLTLVPNVCRLQLSLDELSNGPTAKPTICNLPALPHLTSFQLRSVNLFWTFDEITSLLKAMPSLRTFAIDLRTDDQRLVNESDLLKILPETLIKLDYFIRYYRPRSNGAKEEFDRSQSVRFPVACLSDEPRHRYLIHTIDCDLRSMILPANVGKQLSLGWKYTQHVEDLHIYDATSLRDIITTVQHFRRIRTLSIDMREKTQTCKYLAVSWAWATD